MSQSNQTLQDVLLELLAVGRRLESRRLQEDNFLIEEKDVKNAVDQALKEISELLLDCKPEKPIYDNRRSPKTTGKTHGTKDFVIGYNQAIDDYEKNIKEMLK